MVMASLYMCFGIPHITLISYSIKAIFYNEFKSKIDLGAYSVISYLVSIIFSIYSMCSISIWFAFYIY